MYHLSAVPIKKLTNTRQPNMAEWKPRGFWYAKGRAWVNFLKEERIDWPMCYLYKVNIDPNLKILRINTLKKYHDFIKKYPVYKEFVHGRTNEDYEKLLPNWRTLSKEYDGFEIIIPNFQKLKLKNFGMGMFDVPSGCLWRPGKTKLILAKKLFDKYCLTHTLDRLDGAERFTSSKTYKNEMGDYNMMQGVQRKSLIENSRIAFMYEPNSLVGTAKIVALPKKGFAELLNVRIFKRYRGKGLCRRLVSDAVKKYKEEFPDTKILLIVADSNTAAIKCYTKVGFKKYTAKWLLNDFKKEHPEIHESLRVMAI